MTPNEVTELTAALKEISTAVHSANSSALLETGIGWLLAIFVAVLGAMIAGSYVKQGVIIADKRARKADVEKERHEIENLRKALLVEIDVIATSYQENAGILLEATPDGQPVDFIYPVHQRYFIIYEENAHLIGKIPDDRERELIVQAYTKAKGLLDSYRLNNNLTEKHNFAVGLGPVVLGQNTNFVVGQLNRVRCEYSATLKKMHSEAFEAHSALRESLSKPVEWTSLG